ncbi:MAG TPA: hypothetical protein VJU61_15615, partial [Polyangiaceae bacterium]|nr:hypothetical protein [Polyangiaceae bacterium]
MQHTFLIVTVLAAAGLAAFAGAPEVHGPVAPQTPPAVHAHLHATDDETDDPHAGLYGAEEPHADHAWHAADPHGPGQREAAPAVVAVERSRAGNGRTVAEIFEQRTLLAGKRVSVRSTVVRAT